MAEELLIVTPDHQSRRVTVDDKEVSLGRAHTNDLCYPEDASLSRRHMLVRRRPDGIYATPRRFSIKTIMAATFALAALGMTPFVESLFPSEVKIGFLAVTAPLILKAELTQLGAEFTPVTARILIQPWGDDVPVEFAVTDSQIESMPLYLDAGSLIFVLFES